MKKRNELETLAEARQFLKDNYQEGTICPCCGQNVKLYKRKLGSSQARALIFMFKQTVKWTHIRDIVKEINIHGDLAKLKYWNLVEERPNNDTKKKNSGWWTLTKEGEQFVSGRKEVPSHILIYNAKFLGYSGTTTTIKQALGKHFDYEELMCS